MHITLNAMRRHLTRARACVLIHHLADKFNVRIPIGSRRGLLRKYPVDDRCTADVGLKATAHRIRSIVMQIVRTVQRERFDALERRDASWRLRLNETWTGGWMRFEETSARRWTMFRRMRLGRLRWQLQMIRVERRRYGRQLDQRIGRDGCFGHLTRCL